MKYEEIHILRDRIKEDTIKNTDSSASMEYCRSMDPDGSWSDVDYASQAWANWPLRIHFRRLKEMSCAYVDQKSIYYRSTELKKAVCSGIDLLIRRKWSNPNWWNMEILPQQELRYTALLMSEELGEKRTQFIIDLLQDTVKTSWTGANRIWFAENVMFKGILNVDAQLIKHASEFIMSTADCEWDELSASDDGIQPDGSFTQHGRLLYNNGYGAAWLDSISFWIYQLRGLSFGAKQGVYEIAVSILLDGTAWMQHRGVIDPGTCGREISRKRLGSDERISRAAKRLLETAKTERFPRMSEIGTFVRYLESGGEALPEGNKMFWRVDYMSHRRCGFLATVKMLSRGVKGSESILNENKLGGFLSYGMTVFMRHGKEYFGEGTDDGIFPVMDWTHIPGVTAPVTELSAADTNGLDTAFAGGVTNGHSGSAAMEYAKVLCAAGGKIGFGGKKAYFFFDKGAVILGAGLYCDSPELNLDTTINQSRFAGVSYVDGNSYGAVKTQRTGRWVNHDQTGYVFFEPVEYFIEQGECIGAWECITDSYPSERGNMVKQNVFKLYVRHGVNVRDKSCAYMVLPGQSAGETQQTAEKPPVKIISNSIDLQAVYFEDQRISYMIFYDAGECVIHEGITVTADGRCMLMLRETEEGVRLYASEPETPGAVLKVSVERNKEKTEKTVVFPMGASRLGKTIEVI